MKFLITKFILSIVIITQVSTQKYTTKYDNINLEEILRNSRIFNVYVKCLLDKGKCTADGRELKRIIPDALTNRCASCSAQQRAGAMRVIAFITANRPSVYKELTAKYDPQGLHAKRLKQLG